MSMFNTQCLCIKCAEKEKQDKDYEKAVKADHEQLRQGITILKVQEHTRNGSPSSHLGNGEKTSEQSFEDLLAQNIQAESERRERIEALTEASYRLLKEEKGKEEEAEEKLRAALLSTQPTLHFASPDNHPCSLHQHCPTMRLPVFHIHIRPRFLSYKMC